MIGYIKGKIIHRGINYIIVDTGAVGYKIFVPDSLKTKKEVALFTYHQVREDASDLFGFESAQDLEIFEMLLSVSGVGPKVAMAIVTALGRDKIISAITKGETTVFKSISGIGTKVAAKIIVELRSKISKGDFGDDFLAEDDETIEALASLGLKKSEIMPVLRELPDNIKSVQDKVKFVLKNVGRKK